MPLPKLPILSSIQWWIFAGVLAVASSAAGTAGYKIGVAVQSERDNAALRDGIASANAAAAAAQKQADDQAAQYKKENADRDKREALANQLYEDLRTDATATSAKLTAAQNAIKEFRKHDPQAAAVLDAPIPADLRQRVCAARGEACN